jgi:hypothetical protein
MEKRSLLAGVSSRALAPLDLEGALDTMFVDELGMKVAHVINAKGGVVIGTYDKDNVKSEIFVPVDLLVATFAADPEVVKRSHHKKKEK